MSNLVPKKEDFKIKAKSYLYLLSKGGSDAQAREEIVHSVKMSETKTLVIGVTVGFGSYASLIGSLTYAAFNGYPVAGNALISGFLLGIPLSCFVVGEVFKQIRKSQLRKYSREKLLNALEAEDKDKALGYLEAYEKQRDLVIEYKNDERAFVAKHFGQCNEVMVAETQKLVEKDPKVLLALMDPESEEHKKIKPPSKIVYKV